MLGSGAGVLNRCPSPVSGRTAPRMPPGHLCNLRPSTHARVPLALTPFAFAPQGLRPARASPASHATPPTFVPINLRPHGRNSSNRGPSDTPRAQPLSPPRGNVRPRWSPVGRPLVVLFGRQQLAVPPLTLRCGSRWGQQVSHGGWAFGRPAELDDVAGQPLCPCGMTTAHLVAASACRANDGLSTSVPVVPCGPVVCSIAGRAETSFRDGQRGLAPRGERLTLRTRSASRRGGQENAHAGMAVCAGALCTGVDTRFCRPARRHPGIRHVTSTPQPSPGGGSRQSLLPPTPAARSCSAPAPRTRLHGTRCTWPNSLKV